MAALAAAYSFFTSARKQWADGMQHIHCTTTDVAETPDGGMVYEISDEQGRCALFVVPPDVAIYTRAMHGIFLHGIRGVPSDICSAETAE